MQMYSIRIIKRSPLVHHYQLIVAQLQIHLTMVHLLQQAQIQLTLFPDNVYNSKLTASNTNLYRLKQPILQSLWQATEGFSAITPPNLNQFG